MHQFSNQHKHYRADADSAHAVVQLDLQPSDESSSNTLLLSNYANVRGRGRWTLGQKL